MTCEEFKREVDLNEDKFFSVTMPQGRSCGNDQVMRLLSKYVERKYVQWLWESRDDLGYKQWRPENVEKLLKRYWVEQKIVDKELRLKWQRDKAGLPGEQYA